MGLVGPAPDQGAQAVPQIAGEPCVLDLHVRVEDGEHKGLEGLLLAAWDGRVDQALRVHVAQRASGHMHM